MTRPTISTSVRISKLIMALAALSALAAGMSAFSAVSDASAATKAVEVWRLIGLFTFSALFALLALKPETDSRVWCIVILNKAFLTLAGIMFTLGDDNVAGASDMIIFDGGLTLAVFAAYLLSRRSTAPASR